MLADTSTANVKICAAPTRGEAAHRSRHRQLEYHARTSISGCRTTYVLMMCKSRRCTPDGAAHSSKSKCRAGAAQQTSGEVTQEVVHAPASHRVRGELRCHQRR